ncbi:MAG TPA: hypothetical protein VM030_07495 [Acidimicrobiales bacterium]|nr:hypothetical protein [Acidimicrobiales bacterium]
MRRFTLVLAVVAVLAGTPALAKGPSGSTESKDNQVKCNHDVGPSNGGVNVYGSGAGVFLGPTGAEVCSDNDDNVDGRAIVSSEGYVSIDGDRTNSQKEGTSWARIDTGGPSCGDTTDNPKTEKDNDATLDQGSACP